MALFKEYKKKSVSDPRQTFEAIVNDKLNSFEENILKNNSQSVIAENDRIEFLLDICPFIKDYYEANDDGIDNNHAYTTNTTSMDRYVTTKQANNNKGAVYEKYMKSIGESNIVHKVNDHVYCQKCNVCRTYDPVEANAVCPECGDCKTILESNTTITPTTSGEQNEATPYYAYKRQNHFSEWLSQLQGKETTFIPDSVYDSLLNELRKERMESIDDITHSRIRGYLKKLRLNKYYEHIPHIIRKLKGVAPPKIKPEIEETLRQMFYLIQEPFKKHCPSNRKNFLSYSYCLYKMAEIIGEDDMLENFTLPLLKSRDKLSVQDKIWKGICSELNWQFIPTI